MLLAKIKPKNIAIYTDISLNKTENFGIGIRIRDLDRDILLWNHGLKFNFKEHYPKNTYTLTTINAELEGIIQAINTTIGRYGQSRSLHLMIHTDIRQAQSFLKRYRGTDPLVLRYIRLIKRARKKHIITFIILSDQTRDKFDFPDHASVHNIARRMRGLV
ncbi:hypothetical protein A5881_002126 [Enterococcus termitis]|nr:hypothetical protein A5881_001553 [Enterococcus termitis]